MKKALLLLFPLFMAASCVTVKQGYSVTAEATNYGRYMQKGFYITEASSVSFDYTPVGHIRVEVTPGYEKEERTSTTYGNETYADSPYQKTSYVYGDKLIYADIYDALDRMVEECAKMGANGVICLEVRYEPAQVGSTVYANGQSTYEQATKIIIDGMAIRK